METRLLQFVSRVDGMPYGFHLKVNNPSDFYQDTIPLYLYQASPCRAKTGQ